MSRDIVAGYLDLWYSGLAVVWLLFSSYALVAVIWTLAILLDYLVPRYPYVVWGIWNLFVHRAATEQNKIDALEGSYLPSFQYAISSRNSAVRKLQQSLAHKFFEIADEILRAVNKKLDVPFSHTDKVQKAWLGSGNAEWGTIWITQYKMKHRRFNKSTFPTLFRIAEEFQKEVPILFVSVLHPNAQIPFHKGPNKGVYRFHFAIKVPKHPNAKFVLKASGEAKEELGEEATHALACFRQSLREGKPSPLLAKEIDQRCRLEVLPFYEKERRQGREEMSKPISVQNIFWPEGVGFIWDDTLYHQALNLTRQKRIIIFADVLREFPQNPGLHWGNIGLRMLLNPRKRRSGFLTAAVAMCKRLGCFRGRIKQSTIA